MCKYDICFHDDLGPQYPALFSQRSHTLVPDAEGTGQASLRPLGWGQGLWKEDREQRYAMNQAVSLYSHSAIIWSGSPTWRGAPQGRWPHLPPPDLYLCRSLPWHPFLPPPYPAESYRAQQPAQSCHGQGSGQHRPLRIAAKIPQSQPSSGPSHSCTSHAVSVVPQHFAHLYAWSQNSQH